MLEWPQGQQSRSDGAQPWLRHHKPLCFSPPSVLDWKLCPHQQVAEPAVIQSLLMFLMLVDSRKNCTQARTEVSQIFAEPLCNNPTLRLHWAHEWLDRTLSYKTGEDTASVLCPTLLVWIYKLWMEQNVTFCSVFSLQHLFCYSENIPYGCTGNSINYVVCWYKILTVCTHMYHKHDRLL